MEKKTFLLVYSDLYTGGVETLIVRMSNWLIRNGHTVKLLLRKKSDLDYLLESGIKIKYFGWKYNFLNVPILNKVLVSNKYFSKIDVIYSFGSDTCWISSLIHKHLEKKPAFLSGVYRQNEYDSPKKSFQIYFYRMIKEMIPVNSILFMNSNCLRNVERNLRKKFNDSNILPLPVNTKSKETLGSRHPVRYKIVSIGRIIDFKTYNFHMLDIISRLKNVNKDVVYEIYGHGPLEKELKEKITKQNLEEYVSFKGKLEYSKLNSVLSNAYLFIGMGTSLIEASTCGVPSIVAIFNNKKETCYGFFHNKSDFNVGEIEDGATEFPLESVFTDAFSWSEEQYYLESNKALNYSSKFNIDNIMRNFISFANQGDIRMLNYLSNRTYYSYFFRNILIKIIRDTIKTLFGK